MTVSSIFNLIALLVTLAAVFGYINRRWLRFPHTIGLLIIALTVSLIVLLVDAGGFQALILGKCTLPARRPRPVPGTVRAAEAMPGMLLVHRGDVDRILWRALQSLNSQIRR